jgi:glycine/D-amino acid oxidase-like deaminating enzyme
MQVQHSRAVVLGASMSGLLAARVLSKHFERVTLVERDRLPEGDALRKGCRRPPMPMGCSLAATVSWTGISHG